MSCNHEKNIILCVQETWKYKLPTKFVNKYNKSYNFLHEPAMKASEARSRGRPYGGIGVIISKRISYKINYVNPRCYSLILTDSNTTLTNVYLPYLNRQQRIDDNNNNYVEAIGHIDASHALAHQLVTA